MQAIATLFARLFSLRLVVACLAFVVMFGAESFSWLSTLDRFAFSVGQTLGGIAPPATSDAVALPSEAFFQQRLGVSGLLQPSWSAMLTRGLTLAGLFFLILGLPRVGAGTGLLLTALLGIALLLTQTGLQLYRQQWLPLGQVVQFLCIGFVIMLFWLQPYREIQVLRWNVERARTQLGKILLKHGQLDEALDALAECPATVETLNLLYDIAIQQERKRAYDGAIQTYQSIQAHQSGFRDVDERLLALEELSAGTLQQGGTLDGARTLVMPELAVSKPTLGRYQIEREIGRGAMGVVYLGKDPKIARTVAIKTLSYAQFEPSQVKELKSRFFREAEAAGRLNHPAIITVYDVGEESDLAFIAMDFAQGKPLSAFGKGKSLLPLPVVFDVVARVAEALDYAHRQRVVHRDIKPANIIYNPKNGDLKVTDFGIAKISDESKTRTGSIMGSPLYMSPEQLRGQKVTGASDIYSLGITFYKLVSGETPFEGDSLANLTYQILSKRPRSVRELRPELPASAVRIINKAIQKEPGKRFATASEMAEALRRTAVREFGEEAAC